MYPLRQNTAIDIPVFFHDLNGDGVPGIVDAAITKRISQNGAAFAAMTVVLTEQENGWYQLPLTAAHTNTLGILTITLITGAARQVNLQFRVSANVTDDLPTVAQLNARTLPAADYFDPAADAVAQVTLCVSNADMRGTNGANTVTPPTAIENADALLTRDWTAIVGAVPARCALNALRWLRNRWTAIGNVLTVTEEDDTTVAWTAQLTTDANANPTTGSDPA